MDRNTNIKIICDIIYSALLANNKEIVAFSSQLLHKNISSGGEEDKEITRVLLGDIKNLYADEYLDAVSVFLAEGKEYKVDTEFGKSAEAEKIRLAVVEENKIRVQELNKSMALARETSKISRRRKIIPVDEEKIETKKDLQEKKDTPEKKLSRTVYKKSRFKVEQLVGVRNNKGKWYIGRILYIFQREEYSHNSYLVHIENTDYEDDKWYTDFDVRYYNAKRDKYFIPKTFKI